MAKLAPISPSKLEDFVLYVGCTYKRTKGSHKVYWRDDLIRPVIIPVHKDVPVFVIRTIIRQLGISVEQYCQILDAL